MRFSLSHTQCRHAMLWVAIIALAGCTSQSSKQLVKDYAEQSIKIHQAVDAVYVTAEQARVDAILSRAVRDGVSASELNIAPIPHTGQRQALADLIRYANLLYALASDEHDVRLDNTSAKLHDTLNDLANNPFLRDGQPIDESDISSVSTAINALGRAMTETSRHQQLRAVMEAGQPVLQQTITRLQQDLPNWKMATRVSFDQALSIRLQLLNNPNPCQQSKEMRCITLHTSYDDRLKAYRQAYRIKQALLNLDTRFAQLDLTLSDYLVMHEAIITSLTIDNTASLQGARRAIDTTKQHLDALKDFQQQLEE
ncbi:hypothetical protein [Salinivibrio costicola]|uniref:Uncharacterized protein n=1 Tax=Salinivibrio costicola TaxID=51367 RepID=A0ABX6K7P1_SALCS|nr:hypothetical protein [Salinivibrio costicola]QIR06255.1 hypothetical protein HBA18_07620 [Salinivibrio costicola]